MTQARRKDHKLKLYVLPDSLYPRRITIYLNEKGIMSDVDIVPVSITQEGQLESVPGRPPGSLPILDLGNGKFIRQSLAILEYLEDIYPQPPFMRGATPEAAARVRELMDISVEVCTVFSMYVHKASKLFEQLEPQSEEAARLLLDRLHHLLKQLEDMSDPVGPFLSDDSGQPMLVDCVMLSTIQFAKSVYDVDLTENHPRLAKFLEHFQRRDSSRMGTVFPLEITDLAKMISVR